MRELSRSKPSNDWKAESKSFDTKIAFEDVDSQIMIKSFEKKSAFRQKTGTKYASHRRLDPKDPCEASFGSDSLSGQVGGMLVK